jgi:hypothetical protein
MLFQINLKIIILLPQATMTSKLKQIEIKIVLFISKDNLFISNKFS